MNIKESLKDSYISCLLLVKILIPVSIAIKIATHFGAIDALSKILAYPMSLLNLPGDLGVVWATAMLANIYAGIFTFFSIIDPQQLNVAQVSILGAIILFAHSLPNESAICKLAGLNYRTSISIRISVAFIFGLITSAILSKYDLLNYPPNVLEFNLSNTPKTLPAWAIVEFKRIAYICLIVTVLHILMDFLKFVGFNKILSYLLKPLRLLLGVSEKTTEVIIAGLVAGLGFGGGMILREIRKGEISAEDVKIVLIFLCLCHAIVEDTLLVLAFGADLSVVLWARLGFVFLAFFVIRLFKVGKLSKVKGITA